MLIWAPLVCLSRVLTGLHYLTDILGGMLLGLLLGLLFIALGPLWLAWFPFLF
jgi:membrane-associated phospholipid phosphatase